MFVSKNSRQNCRILFLTSLLISLLTILSGAAAQSSDSVSLQATFTGSFFSGFGNGAVSQGLAEAQNLANATGAPVDVDIY